MLNSTLRAPIRQLGAVVRATPASTLNASWSRSFASQADTRIGGQLWRSLAQDSFQSTLRRSRLGVPQPISGFPRAARRGFRSTAWRRSNAGGGTGHGGEEAQPQTLRGRLRKLMREYGWVAVGVYFGLSFVDLPLSFLIVKIAGADTIGRIEHYIVSAIGSIIPESIRQGSKDLWQKVWQAFKKTEQDELGNDQVSEKVEMVGWGVEEAQERNKEDASLATQLALAYAIHKSFIFIRVPLTAALTPKVVKVLRSWGWNIGKRTRRS